MFEPLVSGRIDTEGLRFEIHLADVEELNKAAKKNTYDITKLSFNAYTQLTETYQLLNSGSALGRKCGPLLIAKNDIDHHKLENSKVAIPGENTTANFLLSFAFPEINKKEEVLFSEIESSVLEEKVDAGVIIHENRFTFQDKGLIQIRDLGEYWEENTGYPIPLGGIVTRRTFTQELKQKIDRVIARSVAYALQNPNSGMEYIRCHAQEMDEEVMRSHINLYVNEFSANIGNEGRASIQFLFDHHPGTQNKNYTSPLFVEHDKTTHNAEFLSGEYWSSRYQNDKTGWDIGIVSTPIKEYIDQLNRKSIKILIPGAGNAHEAEYLHHQGFNSVFVCDIAQEALNNLLSRCPTFPKKNLIQGNFFDLQDKYDLILEQTFFCALQPSLRTAYVQKMKELLHPKGKLAGLLFGVEFPFQGPPFGGKKE
ncbi:MAG: MqnA/MqnD/SBP family protein, partial [Bacteroidota bacterium]